MLCDFLLCLRLGIDLDFGGVCSVTLAVSQVRLGVQENAALTRNKYRLQPTHCPQTGLEPKEPVVSPGQFISGIASLNTTPSATVAVAMWLGPKTT